MDDSGFSDVVSALVVGGGADSAPRARRPAFDRMELWRRSADGAWSRWNADGGGWIPSSAPDVPDADEPTQRLWLRLPDGRWEPVAPAPASDPGTDNP